MPRKPKRLPRKLKIEMTPRDVRCGKPDEGDSCPIALAAKRSLYKLGIRTRGHRKVVVHVDSDEGLNVQIQDIRDSVQVRDYPALEFGSPTKAEQEVTYLLPRKANDFMATFDATPRVLDRYLQPYAFKVSKKLVRDIKKKIINQIKPISFTAVD
jgi:hypothetical protein